MTKREKNLKAFKEHNEIVGISIIEDETHSGEASFSSNGCDVCDDGLGNNVYDCHAWSPNEHRIIDGFQICHECICFEYNGDE